MYFDFSTPTFKTVLSEITWPALQNSHGANLMTILYQLDESQWWNTESLLELQFKQLNNLFVHSYNTVPFYRQNWQKLGINPLKRINIQSWQNIPLLTDDQIQQQQTNLHSQFVPPNHGKIYSVTTLNSTGNPMTVAKTDISTLLWQAFALREHYWQKRDFSLKFASIRHFQPEMKQQVLYPTGLINKTWGPPVDLLHPTGLGLSLDIFTNISDQVEWLTRNKPEYILTSPSNAFALAEYCYQQSLKLPFLRQIKTFGKIIDSQIIQMCYQAWNVSVSSVYYAEQVGCIALQCPEHEHYHLQSEGVYTEILNEENQPCQPGEIGKVVVTPLHNFAMPLIRYVIGDYAEVGEPCSCGRGLPVIRKGIIIRN